MPHLLPELWSLILSLFVREELAAISTMAWQYFAAYELLPATVLRLCGVAHSWRAIVRSICAETRNANLCLDWDRETKRLIPYSYRAVPPPVTRAFRLEIGFDKIPADECNEIAQSSTFAHVLAAAKNVRRLCIQSDHAKTFIPLAARLCPSLLSFELKGRPYSRNPDEFLVDPRILEQALTRWHDAGYGGLRNLLLESGCHMDDRFALNFVKACPLIREFCRERKIEHFPLLSGYPDWKLSAAVWDELINSIDTWDDFEWANFEILDEQPNGLARRMSVFSKKLKPSLLSLTLNLGSTSADNKLTRGALTAMLQACPRLRCLHIQGSNFKKEDGLCDGLFTTLANHCPRFDHVNLRGINSLGLNNFHMLACMPHLRRVDLFSWNDMTPQHLLLLAHVPTSVTRREIYVDKGNLCHVYIIARFLEALASQVKTEAAADSNKDDAAPALADTLSVTTGGELFFFLVYKGSKDDHEHHLLPHVEALEALVSTPRQFTVECIRARDWLEDWVIKINAKTVNLRSTAE
ncbi:hypothetical protein HDU86_006759 [Geranomyces michiganensis]|nr:hypothetical protein HDU86_006759 [Geranomyces michiganensis]